MTFERAVVTGLRGYLRFEGRATRSEFWWFHLFCLLIYVAAYCIGSLVNGAGLGMLLLFVAWTGLLLPWIAAAVRRLHDAGLSGWWLAMLLVPVAGLTWVAATVMLCLSSDRANRHGPPPGAPAPIGAPPIAQQAGRPSVPSVRRRR